MKKILYVSDLDGTLLRSNQTTSEYTNRVINELTDKGIFFHMQQRGLFILQKLLQMGLKRNFLSLLITEFALWIISP